MKKTLNGVWQGWKGDTVVELTDGSKWEQAEYYYEYRYAYRPEVTLTGDLMLVEGMQRAVRVRRLR
ncbi:hypothetical protein [Curtobacterium sp. C2H10]|uniref:hypothetical protein n=1 Tax=Curtobacterium sp. C2H10 TaxID=2736664 RepID=UPI0021BE600D|nr:hypothetical protein [Curtobacterium sp. C2H10]MCT9620523.1 hypothetical protein [Curtobacterium sp. C2H10]